jgi:hypothetical protein
MFVLCGVHSPLSVYFNHFIESPLFCAIFFLHLPSDVALSLQLGLPFGSSGVGNHEIEEKIIYILCTICMAFCLSKKTYMCICQYC